MNTVDLDAGEDPLDPGSIVRWARQRDLAADLAMRERLVEFREALRDWIGAGGDPPPEPVRTMINELDLVVRADGERLRLTSPYPFGAALAPVVDAVRTAIDDGRWRRLKSCDRMRCRWVFYDHSKNAASRWCAASICGAREKARRAHARRSRGG